MTLIKRNFPVLGNLSDFFDDDWLKFRDSDWAPKVNIVENEGSYEIEVAAPGLKKDDFMINLEGNMLTISGKVEKEEEEKKRNYTRKEFSYRSFNRTFTLPEDVNTEDIDANYKDGVLKLMLKRAVKEMPSSKKIAIH